MLEEIGSDRAHCECMRKFASFVYCFLQNLYIDTFKQTFCRSAVKFPSSLVKKLRRIGVETRLKGYKYFEIEREFFNKLGVLLLIVFCKIDKLTLLNIKLINTLSTFRRCQDSRERGNGN
jgi:hypothetical protein